MIQRIQSVWLFLAALVSACLFYFNLYTTHTLVNGTDSIAFLRINDHLPMLLVALVLVILPLVAIFFFKNRKRQRGMIWVNILAALAFIALLLMHVGNLSNQTPAPTSSSYGIGAVLPFIVIVLLFMALRGIRKDDKLVKSLDRLR